MKRDRLLEILGQLKTASLVIQDIIEEVCEYEDDCFVGEILREAAEHVYEAQNSITGSIAIYIDNKDNG